MNAARSLMEAKSCRKYLIWGVRKIRNYQNGVFSDLKEKEKTGLLGK